MRGSETERARERERERDRRDIGRDTGEIETGRGREKDREERDRDRDTRLVGQCSRLSRIAQRSCAGKAIPVQRSCAASTFWRVQIGSTSQISIKTAPVLTLDVHVSMDSRIIIPRDPRRPQVTPEPRVPFSLMQMGSNHKSQREEWVPRTF